VSFEWDSAKEVANIRARGISFSEAATALEDPFALTREDPASVEEHRFVALGLSDQERLLVVVYTYREPDVIRVISAWKATKRQRQQYEKSSS
jgi:uncharacterized DUF497 family protein